MYYTETMLSSTRKLNPTHEYLMLGNANDTSGNGNNGTLVNGSYVTGYEGISSSALSWNSTTGGIQIPVVTQDPSTFSLYFRWKSDGVPGTGRVLWSHRGENTKFIQIQHSESKGISTIKPVIRGSNGLLSEVPYSYTSHTNWMNIALVFNKPGNRVSLYVDKVKVSEITNTISSLQFTSDKQTLNGVYKTSYTYSGTSTFDDFRFFDGYVFTEQDIEDLYNL